MNNQYSNKIARILEEGKKCKERCGVMGPTGPTGPSGPATITIGQTTTGDPGTNASVTNTGTNENVVLNFTIPTGPTGPIGPTGPSGVNTTTLDTYARKYNTTTTNIVLEENIAKPVFLNSIGPVNKITTDEQDTLTITTGGIYKIDYYFNGSSNTNATLTVELTQNNNPIGSTTIIKEVTADEDTEFIGSTIYELTEGDKINLAIDSSTAATIAPASGLNAYINIIKIA